MSLSMESREALIAFVGAQCDEEEALARGPRHWHVLEDGLTIEGEGGFCIYNEGGHDEQDAVHIARHDPARVLREIAAKRLILGKVVTQIDDMDQKIEGEWGSGNYLTGESDLLLTLLGAPYRDRPGWRAEWEPFIA